ncbi:MULTISPECIES: hypothetical protein [Acidobacteriaceae]|uniref:hypothetical protein n=1 Tax=Acidobacteriaceae TaxID=204434 RepID=UPI00131BD2B5|nr:MULTISPECIES: hypothetical protein [Acidobacteriaceae]MDW5265914.1 hypothetical protein [Edaphobacter sp.]
MSIEAQTVLAGQVVAAAQAAGLVVVSSAEGKDFTGGSTTRFTLGLASDKSKTQVLELSSAFDFSGTELAGVVKEYLAETAKRLKSARPDCYLTLGGLPLSFSKFAWPFHESTSGADTSLVHGEIWLEDGNEHLLHSKVAASMTVTFREVVAAPEQPFAESFIYNAVRKTMDQGQLELVKSGNRQPVPVTTRYYNARRKQFIFNDTTETQQKDFLAAKAYWISGVLGGGAPVWLIDPRDAQYLDTTLDELKKVAKALATEGFIQLAADGEYATPTATLMARHEQYAREQADAIAFTKPTFNEDMRGGHTNM